MVDAFDADRGEAAQARVEAVQLLRACLTYEESSLRSAAVETAPEIDLSPNDGDDGMDADTDDSAMEQHVPTVGSCLDTALLLVDACTDVWAGASAWPEVQEQQVVREILGRAGNLDLDAQQCVSLQLAEMEVDVLLDQLAYERDGDAEASGVRLQALLARPLDLPAQDQSDDAIRIRVDIHTAQADLHAALATRITQSGRAGPEYFAQMWTHLSQGISLLNKAIEMPIPPLAMPLAKSSLLNDVSQLSLRRAAMAALGHAPAQKAEAQLLVNAEVYANRALAEGGWGYLCTQAVRTGALGSTAVAVPGFAGYIKEELMEKTILTLCRALGAQGASAAVPDRTAAEGRLRDLLHKTKEMSKSRARRLDQMRVEKSVEELQREEGPLAAWETAFWQNVVSLLGAA